MSIGYLVPRVVRHFLPEWLTRFLLLRSVVIKPGLETVSPKAAAARYVGVLEERNTPLLGKRVLVLGYGGRFDIGVELLDAGAAHVTLSDRYAKPDDVHNRQLVHAHPGYLCLVDGHPRPRAERLELIQADIREAHEAATSEPYDLILSSSVFEHLDDAGAITQALAAQTARDGLHIHFVDLRDHFFRYPFEMLRFSESTWRRWLNPTSNLNRLRLWEYRRIFEMEFGVVEIEVLERDELSFHKVRRHARPEYMSGDPLADAATLIRIVALEPRYP